MYYAIENGIDASGPTLRRTLVLFDSRSERDAYVSRHWVGTFPVTARDARRWIRRVDEVDSNGTDPGWWIGDGGYPRWLQSALDRAVHVYGTYDCPTYVLAR